MQYRGSFLIGVVGQFLATVVEFVAIWTLFDRFGSLQEWTFAEVAVFYGVAHMALAWADMLSAGFDYAGQLIRTGGLDRLLLRPRSTVLQLLGHEFEARRLGRLVQGGIVLAWGAGALRPDLAPVDFVVLAAAIFGGGCLFLGLFVLRGTLSIWTVQSLEIVNAATYGGVTAAQYPMTIYEAWFRRFFTFMVPLLGVIYLPVVAALGRPDPLGFPDGLGRVTWLLGPAFLAGAILAWNVGVRHYTSTGS